MAETGVRLGDCWDKRADFHALPGIGGQTVWGASRDEQGTLNVFSKAFGPYPDVQFTSPPLEGVVLYDGQGQDKDQEMVRSNAYLQTALETGEAVRFLYQEDNGGPVCFVAWKRVWSLHHALGAGEGDKTYRVFKWVLVPSDERGAEPPSELVAALEELDLDVLDEAVRLPGSSTSKRRTARRARALPDPLEDLDSFLSALRGQTVFTLRGRPNVVLNTDADEVLVGTERSPHGEPVAVADVRRAFALLVQDGFVRVHPSTLGHRSSFLGALLLRAPGVEVETDPFVIRLRDEALPTSVSERAGVDLLANPRRKVGTGYVADSKLRRAIEMHAVASAIRHYQGLGYEVRDVGAYESFDLVCAKGTEELRVEVKGSTTAAEKVHLTANEVANSRTFENCALYIVSGIAVDRQDGAPQCTGGQVSIFHPWRAEDEHLTPVAYRYEVPSPPPSGHTRP